MTRDGRQDVKLSLQRALLGMVTPELRAVTVSVLDGTLRARFVYALDLARNAELADEVATELWADHSDSLKVDTMVEVQAQGPVVLNHVDEELVYARFERGQV